MKGFIEKFTQNELLLLENQISFPLYVTAKKMIAGYRPFLERLNLTYTQYLVMIVLWEHPEGQNVRRLGEKLCLDSGTLTPVLKKLVAKGYVEKEKDYLDERVVNIRLTEEGAELKKRAYEAPLSMINGVQMFSAEDAIELKRLLLKLHESLSHIKK